MNRPGPDVPTPAERRPSAPGRPERRDPFVAARQRYWHAVRAGRHAPPVRRSPATGGLLTELVEAEYALFDPPPRPGSASVHDVALARLRSGIRTGDVPSPETCVRAIAGGAHARSAVAAVWPDSLRRHGVHRATAALRGGLSRGRDPETTSFLLDLAAVGRLLPLPGEDLARFARSPHRRVRHAAWRLLVSSGHELPEPTSAAGEHDAYERLLLDALRHPGAAGPGTTGGRPGVLVAQAMLMGSLDRPGEGLSGGLGVLLGALGDSLARTDGIAGVVTAVTACRPELEADPVLLRRRSRGHWILRLPVDSDRPPGPEDMGGHREETAWWAARLLGSLRPRIDVLHVRYSDDGSLALAEAARRIGARLVFTATPDPHRQMTERHGAPGADPVAVRHDLHRVFLGDCLVARADRVVGIAGRDGGAAELLSHFPQLAGGRGTAGIGAPPEGIAPYRPGPGADARCRRLVEPIAAALEDARVPAPTVLLSVGRLHPVKQQDVLVRAWIESGCHEESLLVLVGGSPGTPGPAEDRVRTGVEEALASCPDARNRILMLPALSNSDVRLLERTLADPSSGIRARYVCPSAKEEFGLAVLEAMDAGMLVAGPLRGGVPHYLVDGHNGLLIDTSSVRSLGAGLTRLVRTDDRRAAELARRARLLVGSSYSVGAMARALGDHYRDTADRREDAREGAPPVPASLSGRAAPPRAAPRGPRSSRGTSTRARETPEPPPRSSASGPGTGGWSTGPVRRPSSTAW
ncbi:glycosyltransferase [Streptomyces sp. NPDC004266]|uniref:glycosyltransferase n=1 Tax=Streptomyces sp. NPDC004266 TaxID=3364693 RepID=UPI0036A1C291